MTLSLLAYNVGRRAIGCLASDVRVAAVRLMYSSLFCLLQMQSKMKVFHSLMLMSVMTPVLVASTPMKRIVTKNEATPGGVRGSTAGRGSPRRLKGEKYPKEPYYPDDHYYGEDPYQPKPWSPGPQPWYPEDPYYPGGDGKGGKKSKKKSKGGGMMGGKGGGKGGGASKRPPTHPSEPEHPIYPPTGECIWYKLDVTGFSSGSQAVFPPDANINDIGVEFTYNGAIFEDSALTIPVGGLDSPSQFLTGVCTRFQSQAMDNMNNTIVGAGTCQFTVTTVLVDVEGTIQLAGELFDITPSTLSITGGTDFFVGASGQVSIVPEYAEGTGTDVFTQATYYAWSGFILFEVCDPYHYVDYGGPDHEHGTPPPDNGYHGYRD